MISRIKSTFQITAYKVRPSLPPDYLSLILQHSLPCSYSATETQTFRHSFSHPHHTLSYLWALATVHRTWNTLPSCSLYGNYFSAFGSQLKSHPQGEVTSRLDLKQPPLPFLFSNLASNLFFFLQHICYNLLLGRGKVLSSPFPPPC